MGILGTAAANTVKFAIGRALPDRCAVTRSTRTQDPLTGAWTADDAVVVSGVPCRVDKSGLSPRERAIADRLGSVQTFTLMLSAYPGFWPGGAVDVRSSDHLTVTGDGTGTYEPAEDGGPVTDEMVREIICTRIG